MSKRSHKRFADEMGLLTEDFQIGGADNNKETIVINCTIQQRFLDGKAHMAGGSSHCTAQLTEYRKMGTPTEGKALERAGWLVRNERSISRSTGFYAPIPSYMGHMAEGAEACLIH
uniref:Uncharacterized protein n=1 Tax=Nelumbo nucifera TaxID=4432 RepID=A0A822Z8G1_NELNU|nr:TPA_asm: hypothetical protein HUJ06_008429 [Nelumbo nucifera]